MPFAAEAILTGRIHIFYGCNIPLNEASSNRLLQCQACQWRWNLDIGPFTILVCPNIGWWDQGTSHNSLSAWLFRRCLVLTMCCFGQTSIWILAAACASWKATILSSCIKCKVAAHSENNNWMLSPNSLEELWLCQTRWTGVYLNDRNMLLLVTWEMPLSN